MTCIVAIADGPSVWMGADSRVSDDDSHAATSIGKLWRSGGYAIGAAGGGTWFAVLRQIAWPHVASAGWALTGLPVALRSAADRLGLQLPAAEDAPYNGCALVAGVVEGRGRIWYADSDLDVDEFGSETAIGSGGGKAARVGLRIAKGGPNARIRQVLEAMAAIAPDVGPPFTYLRLKA